MQLGKAVALAALITITSSPALALNVAAQANGGIASASSTHSAGYAADGANNGDRKGLNWGNGGGWNDATSGAYPDSLQVNFSDTYTISRIDVFTVQDNFTAPVEPTPLMTFTQWGVTAFQVQYWNGSTWLDVPGGNITGNNRVWRTIAFAPVATSAIRILLNGSLNRYSRIVELEAWTAEPTNVASQLHGGMAAASSTHSAGYSADGANNGDRKGLNWGSGGGWNDATPSAYPDSLQVNFNGTYSINQVDLFTVQDEFAAPVEPTPLMTFTQWGITAFRLQYWNGSTWLDVPGGNITGNNRVWRSITFAPVSTSAIRVLVNDALNRYSRITEIEAWTADTGGTRGNGAPTADLTSPANNTMLAAPATVNLSATAADPDGSVTKVEFYRDEILIATVTAPNAGAYTHTDTNVAEGTYSYIVKAYDNAVPAAVTTSSAVLVTVSAIPSGSSNVAAQGNGGVATTSSTHSTRFPASGVNNGDRKGLNWGAGGGWNDATADRYPDWLQVSFSAAYRIGQIDVFTVQDNFTEPIEPTPSLTFAQYGLTDFQIQAWDGSAWVDVPRARVSGNNLVWRRFAFPPITTSAIRVLVSRALASYSRIVEVEAWTSDVITPVLPPAPPPISLQVVATGLFNPLGIEHSGDGSGRLFIVEQAGRIRIVNGGTVASTPFLDVSALTLSGGEQGLLGVAFHPDYAINGFFYVNYTRRPDGATVIARYQRSASNPNLADPASGVILLTVPQPFANHNGGQLRFGPDGYLYIALGDGGSGNDPGNRAQNLSTPLGKMLRIDVNNGSPYAIPTSNPFQNDGNSATLAEIWAYGLRNPWRFSFDRLTGDLFIADVGQNAWEEINFQSAGSPGGKNYGWRMMEGANCTGLGGGLPCFDPALVQPILQYDHSLGCSVTGGFRYRGTASPALAGHFVYGDFCRGRIWGATQYPSGVWVTNQLMVAPFNISTFGEDQAGELYIAAYNTGVIYRVTAP